MLNKRAAVVCWVKNHEPRASDFKPADKTRDCEFQLNGFKDVHSKESVSRKSS